MKVVEVDTLFSRFRTIVERFPEHSAIVEDSRRISYRALLDSVQAVAAMLLSTGVRRGDAIAVVLPNGRHFVTTFLAIAQVGGIALPLNPSLRELELTHVMRDAKVSLAVTSRELRPKCAAALSSATGQRTEAVVALEESPPPQEVCETQRKGEMSSGEEAQPFEPALYLYSSGSTGLPKRVARTHFNLLYEVDRLIEALNLNPSDRVLGVAPFSHTNGLIRSMIASVLSGATLVPVAQFERRTVGRLVERDAATVFIGVPFMFAMLAETRWPQPVNLSSLRLCISSSAPLPPVVSRRFHKQYGIYVRQLYGTTETGTISANLSAEPENFLDSVGRPLEGLEVEVFSEDRRGVEIGEVGEIGIKSPAAAKQYSGSEGESNRAFWNGYFFPADIGRKNKDGQIYLVGRKSLFINRGGYKVSPYEVEALLQEHPKVLEAGVVGVDTAYGDQKIKAVIVLAEPCEESDIIEYCKTRIAEFKIPSIVEFRARLPKGPTGKILRKEL